MARPLRVAVLALLGTAALAAAAQEAQPPSAEPALQQQAIPGDLPADWPQDAGASLPAEPQQAAPVADVELDRGLASWYGPRFHGRRTASGERFDMHALTAAHRTLPFGTIVRVQSLVNGREVEVRINDRGPHLKQRVIDLSRAAAAALGLLQAGTGTKAVIVKLVRPAP